MPVYKKCTNYQKYCSLAASYNILTNIFLSVCWNKTIGCGQCEFQRNRVIADFTLCIFEILEKYGSAVGQYFSYKDFKVACS
jgi:hypothetical protein